jgi:hypothetical protein
LFLLYNVLVNTIQTIKVRNVLIEMEESNTANELPYRGKGVIFQINDYIRICHGIKFSMLMNDFKLNTEFPNPLNDSSVGIFGTVVEMLDEKGVVLDSITINNVLVGKKFIKIKFDESKSCLNDGYGKNVIIDIRHVVNYTLLGKTCADKMFEETNDGNIPNISIIWNIPTITIPIHLNETATVCDEERLKVKNQILQSLCCSMYHDMISEVVNLNASHRMELQCYYASN